MRNLRTQYFAKKDSITFTTLTKELTCIGKKMRFQSNRK